MVVATEYHSELGGEYEMSKQDEINYILKGTANPVVKKGSLFLLQLDLIMDIFMEWRMVY